MKKNFYLAIFTALILLPCNISAKSSKEFGLTHVKGINSVGLRAGTGWGNTFDVGLSYQYYFHRRWSFITNVDYERGVFNKSGFQAVTLTPGVEASVWHPISWLYIHLHANALVSYDMWEQKDMMENSNGVGVGVVAGFNLEFYTMPELSITVGAQQSWRYTWLPTGDNNYFSPLFSIGLRYNIR